MPGYDKKGPEGKGPMTGRGMGNCGNPQNAGNPGPYCGRGCGRGRGRGFGRKGYDADDSDSESENESSPPKSAIEKNLSEF